ncbi:MAG: single-stranded DNA-binding protein [Opitutaceae bacterium]|nr:single-stranded DNA-binding protein [Opitutaceae bacterium]|tara:strand:- start:12380 stop:12820 length:441 start_codon:yes stop_codon:yes gene_type:complete
MASFNKVILMGNLTRDPELRVTANGLSICKLSLATNRVYQTRDGERKEEVTYVDVDAFGRQAETISKYMSKGRSILIEGRLKLDSWETPQGEKRSKMGVVLENFQFTGSRGDGGDGSSHVERNSPPAKDTSNQAPADDIEEDDVPF